jgi:hypothetical protein
MPKITTTKEQLEGKPPLEVGIYDFRVDGFKPELTKDKQSVNLRPQLRVINHPTHNGDPIFEWLNSQAGFMHKDFCAALGLELTVNADGGATLPGEFLGPDDDPTKWQYVGPIVGRTGKLELALGDNGRGKMIPKIKRYISALPNYQCKESLFKS